MKRSIGSLLTGLVYFGFALSSSAATYSGAGTWKSTDGTSGEYSVGANIETVDENNVTISQTLDFGNKTLNINFVIHKLDETWFEVISGDTNETIGHGYCVPLGSDEGKVCHSDSFTGDDWIESTVKLTPNAIYRLGSKTNVNTGEKVMWNDELTPKAQQ